jgi:hypothetical protein
VDVDAVGEQPRDARAVAFDEWPRAAAFAAAPAEVAAGAAGHGRDERVAGWKREALSVAGDGEVAPLGAVLPAGLRQVR